MKTLNLKKLAVASALGVFALLGTSSIANAQSDRERRQQERIARQQAELEQQRQAEWQRRNGQLVIVSRNDGTSYYSLDPNANVAPPGRYRVNRNGRWYNTNDRGADMLRQAVNEGYRQGFLAGRADANNRRRGGWSNSNMYRTGVYGYQNGGVNRGQYQYYFRQGFQRGYQDGTNSQYQNDYNGTFQYGTYNNGSPSILGTILNQILNIQSY